MKDIAKLGDYLRAFTFSQLQDARNIFVLLERQGYTLEMFMRWIELVSSENGRKELDKFVNGHLYRTCPECGKLLYLRKLCEPKGKGNIKGWQTYWICADEDCCYHEFSLMSMEEQLEALREKRHVG